MRHTCRRRAWFERATAHVPLAEAMTLATVDEDGSPDAERPLSEKGERQADIAGRALAALGVKLDACLSSPKVRAEQTARLACEHLDVEVEIAEQLRGGPFDAAGLAAGRGDVMLVGHSEGGMVAVQTALACAKSGRFRVSHVVTAGSPVGLTVAKLPGSVQVLALENSNDIVPHLDGRTNPDKINVTTVSVRHGNGEIVDDHTIEQSYPPEARDVDASNDPSIRSFLSGASGFFGATSVQTHTFVITRQY